MVLICQLHFITLKASYESFLFLFIFTRTNYVDTKTKTIHSPNWPLPYFGSYMCTWRIRLDKDVVAVKFLFTQMDTRTPYRSSRLCYHRGNDYVRIKGTN